MAGSQDAALLAYCPQGATPDTHSKGRDAFLRGSVYEWPGSRSNVFGACPSLLAGVPRSAAVERRVSNTRTGSSVSGGSARPARALFLRRPGGPCADAGQAKKGRAGSVPTRLWGLLVRCLGKGSDEQMVELEPIGFSDGVLSGLGVDVEDGVGAVKVRKFDGGIVVRFRSEAVDLESGHGGAPVGERPGSSQLPWDRGWSLGRQKKGGPARCRPAREEGSSLKGDVVVEVVGFQPTSGRGPDQHVRGRSARRR